MLRLAFALCFVASAAYAQNVPPSAPPDPGVMVATYRQLLSEANDRIAVLSAQAQANAREAAEWKSKAEKPPEAAK